MLEEFAMEKKSSGRSVQAPVKGNSAESKKNQVDLASNSKVFARAGRRRESTVSAAPKNDYRKPIQQKSKPHDKRPRARQAASGKESAQVVADDEAATLGSVTVPGNKKQNLNHLLNFHYAPRGVVSTTGNWRYQQGFGRKTLATYKHKYNKEQFLLANCQFVVRQENDYSEHLSNPDLLVNWELIEEIHIRSGESLACPICLFPPTAAKITRCGHVYCWSCILHYLALSDKDSRKCPICFEAVNKSDLKSVIPIVQSQYSVGEEVTMRLMRRERGSLLPIPVDQSPVPAPNNFFSVSEQDMDTGYSKLLLASPEEVLSIITREKLELEGQLITEGDCPEKCFMEQALELLRERELLLLSNSSVVTTGKPSANKCGVSSHASTHSIQQIQENFCHSSFSGNKKATSLEETTFVDPFASNTQLNEVKQSSFIPAAHAEDCNENLEEGIFFVDDIETPTVNQVSSASGMPSKQFFFYQAADGQHIFLHALNVRMLEHQYGSLEHCPRLLKGKILEIEGGSMTEELRKRLRYLQHLPVTCQFEIVEIHLMQPTINKETIHFFEEQVTARKRRRQRRARDERRLAKKINEEEKRLMGRCPSPSICLDSPMQFPLCGTDPDCIGSSSPPSYIGVTATSPSMGIASSSPGRESDLSTDMSLLSLETAGAHYVDDIMESPPGVSFAQMLREGKSKKVTPQVPEQTWSARNVNKYGPSHRQRSFSAEYGEELEDYVPVPDYKQSLTEAISKAMENASGMGENLQDGDGGSGKKKKKKKQTILFATGMNFTKKL